MQITCIMCPLGCRMTAIKQDGKWSVTGNTCPRGARYAVEEAECPKRVITSLVKTANGKVLSVKSKDTVKKDEVFSLLEELKSVRIDTPTKIGEVVYTAKDGGTVFVATSSYEE